MENKYPYFTIFTPVYNAGVHLNRLFESILQQTCKDFEWIIIDDGSTDNSARKIEEFLHENAGITAVFIKQSNQGKHQSWNTAVDIARGALFIPADADDAFIPTALSFFYDKWNSFSEQEKLKLSGVNVLCLDNDTDNIVGNRFPRDGMLSNNLELHYKLGVEGEKWGCIRTDLLKKRKFPIVKGSFFPESYLWLHLAKFYKVACYNTPLRRYYTTSTGLTSSSNVRRKNIIQSKIFVKYYTWFLINFGLYSLRYSPKKFSRILFMLCLYSFTIIKDKMGFKN